MTNKVSVQTQFYNRYLERKHKVEAIILDYETKILELENNYAKMLDNPELVYDLSRLLIETVTYKQSLKTAKEDLAFLEETYNEICAYPNIEPQGEK